ncbi:FxsA cytoplasmic membrane protein [Ketogulonicigenium robustum]|uniref:FxsA cytoplasmic membrane protein n=1 Tax=Ketogulonicigenium robustum TaxID=92947 RepID=A0A1W6P2F9_9RHOB|nr:FxsA family protein [Ketogulonicigenium robustum]ARO15702.1 FxsA cytoplasmic membrane protein [Ketogulonicigenium robustum]
MPLYWVFPALVLIEIVAFIVIGGEIGVGLTLLLVLGSTALGVFTLRRLGQQALGALQGGLGYAAGGRMGAPAQQIGAGTLKALASGLLIVPGLVTSALGLVLLIPQVQNFLWSRVANKVNIRTATYSPNDVIDGDFTEVDPDATRIGGAANANSVWHQPEDPRDK